MSQWKERCFSETSSPDLSNDTKISRQLENLSTLSYLWSFDLIANPCLYFQARGVVKFGIEEIVIDDGRNSTVTRAEFVPTVSFDVMKQFLVKLTLVGCVLAHAVADDLLSSEKKQLANDRSNDGEDDSESTVSSINAEAESQAARRAELLEKLEKVLEDIDFFDFDSNLLGIDDPRHARRRNTVTP